MAGVCTGDVFLAGGWMEQCCNGWCRVVGPLCLIFRLSMELASLVRVDWFVWWWISGTVMLSGGLAGWAGGWLATLALHTSAGPSAGVVGWPVAHPAGLPGGMAVLDVWHHRTGWSAWTGLASFVFGRGVGQGGLVA